MIHTTTTVNVTQEFIDAGQPNLCGRCPIALAVNSVLAEDFRAQVGCDYITIYSPLGRHACQLLMGVEAAEFVSDFDQGTPVAPLSFPLDIPPELLRSEVPV